MPKTKEELKQIYSLMVKKLRELSKGNSFDKTMEENRGFTYADQPDDYFFEKMVQVIFEAGISAWVWKKCEDEIRREFCNFSVISLTNYGGSDVERMLKNPKMFKNEKKIKACVHNAKEIVRISSQHNGFWKWIDSEVVREGELIFPKFELIEKVQSTFKWLTGINAYGFLKYVGVDVVKPDSNVRRIMYRLGLTDSDKHNKIVSKQIQEAGVRIAKASEVRVVDVDYVFYLYGSKGVQFFQYPICPDKPKCEECPLNNFCEWYRRHIEMKLEEKSEEL